MLQMLLRIIIDQNANVAHKNIATLSSELCKDINIQINRKIKKKN